MRYGKTEKKPCMTLLTSLMALDMQSKSGSVQTICCGCSTRTVATTVSVKKAKKGDSRKSTSKLSSTSIVAQKEYYTDYIKSHAGWQFVGVYADEGISGCSTKRREQFKQLMSDCMAGKIDMVLTKSISRFGRNTVDTLTAIRELKSKGIGVYFEKEQVWTMDSKGYEKELTKELV